MLTKTTTKTTTMKTGTHAHTLLRAYRSAGRRGLTALEAGVVANLAHAGYWKRVSDLKRKGFITPIFDKQGNRVFRTMEQTGMPQQVFRISEAGREHLTGKPVKK